MYKSESPSIVFKDYGAKNPLSCKSNFGKWYMQSRTRVDKYVTIYTVLNKYKEAKVKNNGMAASLFHL